MWRCWPLLWALLYIGACGESRLTQRCRYGPETVIVEGGGSYIRAVALARDREGLLTSWTDKSGTWVLPISDSGEQRGRAVRVGPPAVSLDLSTDDEGFLIAILRPGHPIWGGGVAMSRELDSYGCPRDEIVRHGRAGCYSEGISIIDSPHGAVLAWQDGTPSDLSVKLSREEGEEIRVSSLRNNGCCPIFGNIEGAPVLLWGQYVLSREGTQSEVLLQSLNGEGLPSGNPATVVKTTLAETWPVLTVGNTGVAGLIYRDDHLEYSRPQAFFLRLGPTGEAISNPARIGRYDGPTKAVLMTNGKVWVNVAVRSWAREQILGFDRFQPDGTRIGAQLHVFADHVRFTDVDALRLGTRYALLFSEEHPQQRVWFAQVTCR